MVLFGHSCVIVILGYRTTHTFIENFKYELHLVKVANSHDLLVWKSLLLDVVVSLGIDGVSVLSRVLETTPNSINIALRRRIHTVD